MELRKFNSYKELVRTHQQDINDFPIIYLFGPQRSKAELDEKLKKINAKSLDECTSLYGAGDVMRKEDVPKYTELCRLHKKEKEEFCKNEKNLENMIYTEMCNHEYSYTEDPDDTLMTLGKSYEDLEDGTVFRIAWDKASKRCKADCF